VKGLELKGKERVEKLWWGLWGEARREKMKGVVRGRRG